MKIESISTRVVDLFLRPNRRYSVKILQVYAPTSNHNDEEIDFYDILKATQKYNMLLMGDFNAKLGYKGDHAEVGMDPFGDGERNHRGDMLLNFLLHHKLVFF